jgi:hypothetical protein
MTTIAVTNFLAVSLSILFGAASLTHLAAPRFLREAYRRWDFARGFHYVAGVAQGFAALFLAVPETWGSVLGAMILFVAIISLLNHRKYAYAVPAILVMVALAPAAI